MGNIIDWYQGRSQREQRLILLMLAIALPLLTWLLIVRPLQIAYDDALQAHLEAVDRNGRVHWLVEQSERGPIATPASAGTDLTLVVAELASRQGLQLAANDPSGQNRVRINVAAGSPIAMQGFLADLEMEGVAIDSLRMAPTADGGGGATLSAELSRTVK